MMWKVMGNIVMGNKWERLFRKPSVETSNQELRPADVTLDGDGDSVISDNPPPAEAPGVSDDPHENDNINRSYTGFIVDHTLHFDREKCIEALKTAKEKKSIDEKLKLNPYPSDCILAQFALRAYWDNPGDETKHALPEGWKLLTIASNRGWFNGYFGVAFWCPDQQQVVVAHRGTKLSNLGALWTDIISVWFNKLTTSHICSAVTFSDAIATALNEMKGEGVKFQLSITGHSLGGWLSQVTAFTVKYLQKDASAFREMTEYQNGFHAHTVVFESPGCKKMLSKIKDTIHPNRAENFQTIDWQILDITAYLSAPNLINSAKVHLGTIYKVYNVTPNAWYGSIWKYTFETHSMDMMRNALEGNPKIEEIVNWPLQVSKAPVEGQCNETYHSVPIDKTCCNLRKFDKDERSFLTAWEILILSGINLTNSMIIRGFPVSDLFNDFKFDNDKKQIECTSEGSIEKLIQQTKALMRWFPGEAKSNLKLIPLPAVNILRTESDKYLRSLEPTQVHFEDTIGLETFLKSDNNILIIRTLDIEMDMTRLANIFLKKCNEIQMYSNDNHMFMCLKTIKAFESTYDIKRIFELCFTDNNLLFIKNTEDYDEKFETILKGILTNLKNNPNSKLVLVESQDTQFENHLKIDNYLVLNLTGEIKLNDIAEVTLEKLFEKKIILLQGELLSLRDFVGKYSDQKVDQLNHVSELMGPQQLIKMLYSDVTQVKDVPLDHDLHLQSTVTEQVSVARVVRALRDSPDTLLAISGIGREDLETERWADLLHSLGEERISTTTEDGALAFKQKYREKPDSTVYWLAASAENVSRKSIYEKGFYIERRFKIFKIILKIKDFVEREDTKNEIFVFRNVRDKQSLISQCTLSEQHENRFLTSDDIKIAISDKEVDDIIENNPNKHIHILKREVNDGPILWQHSRGSLENLRPYVTPDISQIVEEADLRYISQKVVIISDEPGMGKSTTLTSVSRILRSGWVIRLNLKDFPLNKLPNTLDLNSVCKCILRDQDNWVRGFLQICLDKSYVNTRHIYILFDGFDEMKQDSSSNAKYEVLKLLKYLNNNTNARIWVTTRPHTKKILENALSTFAIEFERISEKEQREFLVKFWHTHLLLEVDDYRERQKAKLENCAKYVYEHAKKVLGEDVQDFIGIPLQMRMLAEVSMVWVKENVQSETNIENTSDVINISDLYQQFSRLKYGIYFKNKTGLNESMTYCIKRMIAETIIEKHRMLALHTLFPKFAEENFNHPEDGCGAELCRVGLVQLGGGGMENIEFIHRTLMEYYCADLVVNWLRERGRYHGHAPMVELLLTKILLDNSYRFIVIFIDNLLLLKPLSEEANKFTAVKIFELWQKKHFLSFNQYLGTALHSAAWAKKSGVIDMLMGGLKYEPVLLVRFIAAHNRNRYTALGFAAWAGNLEIMDKIFKNIETCSYSVILEVLLATYVRYSSVLENKIFSDYLKRKAVCFKIKKAISRIKKIIQDIPSFRTAVVESRVDDIERLYQRKKNIEQRYMLLARGGGGETVLHIAAQHKSDNIELYKIQTEIIMTLCKDEIPEVGRSYDRYGRTPLHCAAEAGHLKIVKHLINRGVYIDSLSCVNKFLTDMETALFYAARCGNLKIVKYLVKKGSDVKVINKDGQNVLFSAVHSGSLRVVKYLVKNRSDINILNKNGENVLFSAARIGNLPVLEYLVKRGSNINILNNKGENALFEAALYGNLLVLQYLVEKMMDVNILNNNGENALFHAVFCGSLPVMQYLVEKESDINILNNKGENVLFHTALTGTLPIMQYLVDKGSDINIVNNNGENLLFPAARGGSLSVLEYLIDKRLDINISNNKGENLLFAAARSMNVQVLRYFVERRLMQTL